MAHQVKFTKDHDDYNTEFKKGDIKSVSASIRDSLKAKGVAKDYIEPKKKTTREED